MWGVLRFYNLVRSGITWRGPEAKTAIFAPMYKSVSTHSKSSIVHLEGKRAKQRQRRYSVEAESGCCAIFDFDFDYDDEDEDEDGAEDDVGYDYDDYYDYYEDEDEQQLELGQPDDADCSMLGSVGGGGGGRSRPRTAAVRMKSQRHRRNNNNIRSVLINKRHNKYKISRPQTQLEVINESERSAGSGSDENDSLLVAYDSTNGNDLQATSSGSDASCNGSSSDDDGDDLQPGARLAAKCYSQRQRKRRRSLRRVYCAVNISIMGLLVAVEIYAQLAIFL
ncbi:hypothetical protein AWZ03_013585 [Drosophila navojoa]|uniref:Uncharacterized protein n=1 Tax=Drosophila navojoa TaxID=7232 RepID=A0A484AUE4_DRONA|nr:hypothetical protein AWZ03_013585 [Drosophila navojoa]